MLPVPAPRGSHTSDMKKPIPTPRKNVKKSVTEKIDEPQIANRFSRRVRSFSHASKQIAEDIGELVQDKKKAVIEGTRQNVRKITKRFNSFHVEDTSSTDGSKPQEDNGSEESMDIFSSISFQSPLSSSQNIYNNVDLPNLNHNNTTETFYNSIEEHKDNEEDKSCEQELIISRPPPSHPPPPLPDESIYDAPSSLASGSGSTSNSDHSNVPNFTHFNYASNKPENYESVFPPFNYINNDVEGNQDFGTDNISQCATLSRSGSWKFYDSVTKAENIYNDIDGMVPLVPSTPNQIVDNKFDWNSNLSELSSVDVRNSLYENHTIAVRNHEQNIQRPSKSVILQFDPLRNSIQDDTGSVNPATKDLLLLEELLQGDMYGNLPLNTLDEWSISNDSETDEFLSPPPPPVRIDSLPEEEQAQPPTTPNKDKTRTSWFLSSDNNRQSGTPDSKKLGWLKQFKEVLEKAPDVVRGNKSKDPVVQRPELEIKSFVHKRGMLYKVQGGPVEDLFGEYSGRWCILENSNLICYADNTQDSIREHFPSDTILSVQILQDPKFKYKYDNDDLHCFELNITGKSRGGHIYGTRDISERRIWMQFIAESLTKVFGSKLTSDYTRMGWAYLREGVSGKWIGSWILLSHRTLYYTVENRHVKSMDLRKVRHLVLQMYQENDINPRTNDKGPNMVLDSTNLTLYLRMWTSRETKVWCHIVKLAAHNNGPNLDQQQLTKNDIPVLVEKCINFIYARGSMTEGIYRKSGSNSSIAEILTKFRKDAWAVQLTEKYTEHDIAAALKRFFRDLPEPLLSNKQRQYFYQVSLVKDKEERIRMYKAALECLPPISVRTTKKLLGHLHFIGSQSNRNRMNVDNLAAIWGPTLMHYEDKGTPASNRSQEQMAVVKHLIELYKFIFPEDPVEAQQEKLMLKVLEQVAKSPQGAINTNRKAGDFRVWIYHKDKKGKTFNVAVGPNKSAFDVCAELGVQLQVPVHELILEEVVLNEQLTRPIHHSEKVLDVVLKWSYWEESDRKDNYLVLTQMSKYLDLVQDKQPTVVSDELKFADPKSRNFKIYLLEFSQAKLTCYKDKREKTSLFTWNIEDIVWYFGHETKRNSHSRCTLTFIELKNPPKRARNSIFFGNTIAFDTVTARVSWVAAMLKARYQESLQTPAMHVNLLSN